MRVPTAIGAALGAAALVLVTAGCGGDAKEPSVATAGGTPSAVASGDAVTAYVEGVRGYVACLRKEGVKVSDPDAKGRIEFSGDARAVKADPKFRAAQVKCNDLNPPVPQGLEDKPALTPEEVEKAREYARCMQTKGAPDFPDPGPDGYQPESEDGKPLWNSGSAGAKRAAAACGSIVGVPATPGSGVG
ncbi:hypothetical protein ACFWRG_14620 [Micromonospora tulbaghiae]|uniref:Lipoprotein n=1 Tax=Micromonospora tulbaghiae TaxID=479978 RepID=A0ABY0KH19_9ACTN|nr:hypothetical protein [Micromonospora tulbaghiae]MDX5456157.1 hypothetical protein [Micromonospora tulbaghiae]SCE70985.1 hypothetical protein GA0070562_1976 [Micromonospora tulbaghiae]